ncbi:malonate decarboxylase holo-ACP synthase [Pseudomonas sp. SC11]|uniref:malonate decarboxylase holo-ACP synthase n=1 Tax=Pseudomonas sp. SC11 TaxID=326927 RepID=UPI00399B868E
MNAVRPHDLLWGMTPDLLPADAPAWARQALAAGEPVVVRRALQAAGWVAVGLRGRSRAQRFAARMPLGQVVRRVAPERLRWQGDTDLPALQAVAQVAAVLDAQGWCWGPTGSVGFQLASGIEVVHADSDLDVLLHAPQRLSCERARDLLGALQAVACRIDVQLETPHGAVALREWASGARQVLLKAASAARLVSDPWSLEEAAA